MKTKNSLFLDTWANFVGEVNVIKFILEYILNNVYNSATSIAYNLFNLSINIQSKNLAPFSAEHTSFYRKDKIFGIKGYWNSIYKF